MTKLLNASPAVGEMMTCDVCCRPIVVTRVGFAHQSIHGDTVVQHDHTAAPSTTPEFKVIGPPRTCMCGETFNYTNEGPVHHARASTWRRSCAAGSRRIEPWEDATTVSSDRRYPCANCGRPVFAGDDGSRVRHVEYHDEHGDIACINVHGEPIDDAIATIRDYDIAASEHVNSVNTTTVNTVEVGTTSTCNRCRYGIIYGTHGEGWTHGLRPSDHTAEYRPEYSTATVFQSVHPQPAGGPDKWDPKGMLERLNKQYRHAPDELTRDAIAKLSGILMLHRPTGSNGKHSDHTPTCGCEE